jgi:sulfite exporter TauE/SafE
MMELPLIFLSGLLGSAHCLGMCGGFAMLLGGQAASWRVNAASQSLYTAGRVFTYAVFGSAAGYCGSWLAERGSGLLSVAAVLSLIAGAVLIYQGLLAAGLLAKRGAAGSMPCLGGTFFATLLRGRNGALKAFLAGVFTGFLPCGLLYGMLVLAASTRSITQAALVMMVFGLGTAPAMVVAGLSVRLVQLSWRKAMFKFAAVCLIATGVVTVARGSTLLWAESSKPACPFCAAAH